MMKLITDIDRMRYRRWSKISAILQDECTDVYVEWDDDIDIDVDVEWLATSVVLNVAEVDNCTEN